MDNFRPLTVSPHNLSNCPVCGARWLKGARYDHSISTEFECGGTFNIANRQVLVATPCPAPSNVAAKALTGELHEVAVP